MTELIITVRGTSRSEHRPERATVSVSAVADGPERVDVVATATTAAASLQASLEALRNRGVVEEWSAGDATVWSDRPWTDAGPSSSLVHHAEIQVAAVFADPGAVSGWLDAVAADERHRIHSVQWDLRAETRSHAEREAATSAIGDAWERATGYAGAAGRAAVEPIEIADAGLLAGTEPGAQSERLFAKAAMDASPAGFAFAPAPVVIAASVDVRFRAS